MSRIATEGLLLFAAIPIVLVLFLRQPVGPGWSVALGLAIMAGHRLLAAPWMARHSRRRCLWCARSLDTDRAASRPVPVFASGRTWIMAACSEAHAGSIARFLRFVERRRVVIAAAIFVPLVVLLAGSLAEAAGLRLLPHWLNTLQFRVILAFTVITASLAYRTATEGEPGAHLRCFFPLHNLFLLGVGNTLWVFRIVGAWWLIDAAWRLAAMKAGGSM